MFMFAVVTNPVSVIASSRVRTSTFLFVIFHLVFLVKRFLGLTAYKSFLNRDSRVYPRNNKDITRKTPTTTTATRNSLKLPLDDIFSSNILILRYFLVPRQLVISCSHTSRHFEKI